MIRRREFSPDSKGTLPTPRRHGTRALSRPRVISIHHRPRNSQASERRNPLGSPFQHRRNPHHIPVLRRDEKRKITLVLDARPRKLARHHPRPLRQPSRHHAVDGLAQLATHPRVVVWRRDGTRLVPRRDARSARRRRAGSTRAARHDGERDVERRPAWEAGGWRGAWRGGRDGRGRRWRRACAAAGGGREAEAARRRWCVRSGRRGR